MGQDENEPLDDLNQCLEEVIKAEAAKAPSEPVPPFSKRHPYLLAGVCAWIMLTSMFYAYSHAAGDLGYLFAQGELPPGSEAAKIIAEDCSNNLLKLAAAGNDDEGLACPFSDMRYVHDGTKLSCPTPEAHGLSELYVLGSSTGTVRIPLRR